MPVVADHPLPYLPIRILDISPYRSSVRRPPSRSRKRPDRVESAAIALALAVLSLIVLIAASGPVVID